MHGGETQFLARARRIGDQHRRIARPPCAHHSGQSHARLIPNRAQHFTDGMAAPRAEIVQNATWWDTFKAKFRNAVIGAFQPA